MSIPEKFYIRESSEQMKYLNYLFNFDELTPSSSGIHTFTLVPSEDGYFICGFGGLMCARYDSTQEKIVNLSLADKSKITDEDSALWLIDENSDGTVTIRNKKNPDLVWTSFRGELPFRRAVVAPAKSGDVNQLLRIEAAD
ncbi:hypothetical protein [Pantoea stewartii]|uniref:Uncharacterized protein n=1 Tax=Pantoea stewartii subsp. stewartii DC283 TaxID=660596 RepID=H3RFZ7_PANSE|nr:hypothetical protein [Pantoea stewartii]ARF52224.1 hypothetical protein DSJ_23475 [Pantoea stewartii subsp. stewartii DC283]EHT99612.1 hypothetical protein CKS_1751 [Pantoea stewartii subsp. stewartii DC283]KAB0545806.1 hypothetical protein F7Q90_23070 [Pantoea stewartii subsp. stewartii]